jgi:hypothetical protein
MLKAMITRIIDTFFMMNFILIVLKYFLNYCLNY